MLEPTQRILAEKAINDVLFDASLGNLHLDSSKSNVDSRNWAEITPSVSNNSTSSSQSVSPICDICEVQPPRVTDFFSNFKV